MARTKSKPGPKPKFSGNRVDLHIKVSQEVAALLQKKAEETGPDGKPLGVYMASEILFREIFGLPPIQQEEDHV